MDKDTFRQNPNALTVWDMLSKSRTLEEVSKIDPGFVVGWSHMFQKPYTDSNLSNMRNIIAQRFYDLVMQKKLWYFAYLEVLPSRVLLSYLTIERILSDDTILTLVEKDKISWDGLIRLAEKGKI